jgi:hypothetical protein
MPYSDPMNSNITGPVRDIFAGHTAFTEQSAGFAVATTAFEGVLRAAVPDEETTEYTVRVRVPTLDAATADDVGDAVAADWLRTLRRRLEDAPQATRADVELDAIEVEAGDDTVDIEYVFSWDSPRRAPEIVKALVEFVEGTYVEGVVPGYEYEPPVADLLTQASQGEKGGTPL